MAQAARTQMLSRLRAHIAKAEGWRPAARENAIRLGGEAAPAFRLGVLQELRAADCRDAPAALGFALAAALQIASKRDGGLVWLQLAHEARREGFAYGYGLAAYGGGLERLMLIYPSTMKDFLWAAEEAVRAKGVAAVLMETRRPHRLLNLTATRRLQLAAEVSGATPILFRIEQTPSITAASSRWFISSATSAAASHDGKASGAPVWRVELERCRHGRRGVWFMEYDYAAQKLVSRGADSGVMVSPLGDRPAETREAFA